MERKWFETWYAAYGAGAVSRAGGLYLLDTVRRIGPFRLPIRASATNCHSIRYDSPIGVAADLALDRQDLAFARFEYLSEDSRLLAWARSAQATLPIRIEPHAVAPVADCRATHAHWMAARSKRIRKRLTQDTEKVLGGHGMTLSFVDGTRDLPTLLDEMFAVEQSGWKGRQGTAIADDPADALFYSRLASEAAAVGALRIAVLRHEGRMAAFEYGIVCGRRISLLKVGYCERYADISLGYVLAALHIRHCCEDPSIDWYDKMGNGMTPAPYKLRFADSLDTLYRVTLYARGWRGRLALGHDRARDVAKRLRDAWRARRGAGA